MKVLKPPLEEQQIIVQWINSESKDLESTIEQEEREIDLLREYRTRLISDVVTGKLDVRGVELPELPAEELTGDLSADPDDEAGGADEMEEAEEPEPVE